MSEKEYDIYIHHDISGGENETAGATSQIASAGTTPQKQVEAAKTSNTSNITKLVAVKIGKDALQWGVSNYGNLTGDYLGQTRIQEAIGIGAGILTAAKGGVLGVIAVGATIGIKAANRAITLAKERQETELLRARVGRTISSGGRDL